MEPDNRARPTIIDLAECINCSLQSQSITIIALIKKVENVQLTMNLRVPGGWGGARRGAGRKKTGTRRDPIHGERPAVSAPHDEPAAPPGSSLDALIRSRFGQES